MNDFKIAFFITILFVLHLNPVNAASPLSCTQSQVNINKSLQVGGDLSFTGTLTQGNVPWQRLTGDPLNCSGGTYATGLNPGGNLICSADAAVGPWLKQGNDIYYSSGNVGIGTTTPRDRLHIAGGDLRIGEISSPNTGTFPSYGRKLFFSGGSAGSDYDSDNSDQLWMARYNVSSDRTELRVNMSDENSDKFVVGSTAVSSSQWYPQLTVRSNGNVSIGTVDSKAELDVFGGIRSSVSTDVDLPLALKNSAVNNTWNIYNLHSKDTSPNALLFENCPSIGNCLRTMTIMPSGNVGIRTTEPLADLQIGAISRFLTFGTSGGASGPYTAYIGGNAIIDQTINPHNVYKASNYGEGGSIIALTHYGEIQMQAFNSGSATPASTAYAPQFVLNTSGNIGIHQRLQLGNSQTHWINDPITGFTEPVIGNDGFLFAPGYAGAESSDLRLYMLDNANDRFSIWGASCEGGDCSDLNKASLAHYFDAGGNTYHKGKVGIGTNDPQATLHVNGNIYFKPEYSEGQQVAQATCTALKSAGGWTFAVRREPSSPDCALVCQGLNEVQAGGQLSCFNSLHIYANQPHTGVSTVGLKTYRYNSCGGGLGPNYCCCGN